MNDVVDFDIGSVGDGVCPFGEIGFKKKGKNNETTIHPTLPLISCGTDIPINKFFYCEGVNNLKDIVKGISKKSYQHAGQKNFY